MKRLAPIFIIISIFSSTTHASQLDELKNKLNVEYKVTVNRSEYLPSISDVYVSNKSYLKLMRDKNLSGQADYILSIAENIDEAYFIGAVMCLESGWGTSKLSKNKNNYFGIMAYGDDPYNKATTFDSYKNSIDEFVKIVKGYNKSTIDEIGSIYCESSDWSSKVKTLMNSLKEGDE